MGVSSPSYFINHIIKNKKNMKNSIVVPFDLNTARKIKSGEIEGSVLIDNIEIEFVYESKDCAGPYNLLFVKKDGYGISAIYANTEGCIIGGTTLELRVEAGAYFKKGDVLTSTKGCQFIYDGLITNYASLTAGTSLKISDNLAAHENHIECYRLATDSEKQKMIKALKKSENPKAKEYLKRFFGTKEEPKYDFKPFDKVLVRKEGNKKWNISLFAREIVDDYNGLPYKYECSNGTLWDYCIHFEGNECLLGTTENLEK